MYNQLKVRIIVFSLPLHKLFLKILIHRHHHASLVAQN